MSHPWPEMLITEVCASIVDCVNKTAPTIPEVSPYKMIRTTNVRDGFVNVSDVRYVKEQTYLTWNRRQTPTEGDVILTREAPLGGVGMLREPVGVFLGQRLITYRADRLKLDPYFLLYSMMGPEMQQQIASYGSGATVEHMRVPDASRLKIRVPDLNVQRRIGGWLGAMDLLFEKNLRRLSALEETTRILWVALTSRSIVNRIRVDDLIKSGTIAIGDGYRAKNSELGEPGLPFARVANIDDGFHFENADILRNASVAKAGEKISRHGDVIFTSKGTVGRFARVHPNTPRFVYSPQLCYWRVLQSESLSPTCLYHWMRTRAFVDQIDRVKGSTTMADYVNLKDQRQMEIDVFPRDVQLRLDEALTPIDILVENLRNQNATLRALRDHLLPRLLSGELDVSRLPFPPDEPIAAPSSAPPPPPAPLRRGRRPKEPT